MGGCIICHEMIIKIVEDEHIHRFLSCAVNLYYSTIYRKPPSYYFTLISGDHILSYNNKVLNYLMLNDKVIRYCQTITQSVKCV